MARIQVTVDPDLARALEEFGSGMPRSKAVRDLALRGAEASRQDRTYRAKAVETLTRIANGTDDGFDFDATEKLRRERR